MSIGRQIERFYTAKEKAYPGKHRKIEILFVFFMHALGFYIQTQSSTAAKVKYLQTISAKLNIKLTILTDEIIHSDKLPEINMQLT